MFRPIVQYRPFDLTGGVMRIFSNKISPDALSSLSARDVARICDVSERCARGWLASGKMPTMAARLLALAVGDVESVAGRPWRGWLFDDAGLIGPDDRRYVPGDLVALDATRGALDATTQELARYRAGVPIIDRKALDRLETAAQAAQDFAQAFAGLWPARGAPDASGRFRPAPAPSVMLPQRPHKKAAAIRGE